MILLFKASAETTLTIAGDPKHLGARIGITSVLHTWLGAHPPSACPHDRAVGGIALDGSRWLSCRSRFFLPWRVLSKTIPPASASSTRTIGSKAPIATR